MRIGGDETVAVAHQHQIAVALELVAGISDDTVFRGLDRRAFGHGEVDAVVLQAVRLRAEAGDDPAAHRPSERRQRAGGLCALERAFLASRASRGRRPARCAANPRSRNSDSTGGGASASARGAGGAAGVAASGTRE